MSLSKQYSLTDQESALKQTFREKELIIQRQAKVIQKIKEDRSLLNNELLEWKWKYEGKAMELEECHRHLQRANEKLNESTRTLSNSKHREMEEIELYRNNIKELLHRNEKQDKIMRSLITENKSLRKGIKFSQLKNTQSRLTAPRMSIA